MEPSDLVEEQEYLDVARESRERAREVWLGAAEAGAGRNDQAQLDRLGETILRDFVPAEEPSAIGRLDFLNEEDPIYVGKQTIWNKESDVLVVDWRRDAARPFFTSIVGDQAELRRKRVFEVENHRILSIEDVVFADLERQVRDLQEGQTIQEIAGTDVLLRDLERTRDGQMRDIVRTIQHAQFDLISAPPNQVLVIQGGPGTGKTAIALHRASWLLLNDPTVTPASLLVIGPNKTFIKYISEVLPSLGDTKIQQKELVGIGDSTITPSVVDSERIQVLKGSLKMCEILSRALKQRVRVPSEDLVLQSDDQRVTIPRASVISRIEELVSGSLYSFARTSLREWLKDRARERATRGPVDAFDSSVDRALESIWPQLTAKTFIYDLLSSRDRLLDAAGSDLTGQDVRELQRPTATRIADQVWSPSDLPLVDFADGLINGQLSIRYDHIVVDEAQDLSPMQVLMIKRRSRTSHMTLVGDIAQSTGPFMRESWDDVLELLRGRDGGSIQSLRFGYRVPTEVNEIAARLLPVIAPSVEGPQAIRSSGVSPTFVHSESQGILASAITEISSYAARGCSVGIVLPDAIAEEFAELLRAKSFNFADARAGQLGASINLIPSSMAKGLEFDAVVVVNPLEISSNGTKEGLRLLYIALTRTTRNLSIVYDILPTELDETAQNVIDRSGPLDRVTSQEPDMSGADTSELEDRFIAVAVEQLLVVLNMLQRPAQERAIREVIKRLGLEKM